jgi:hypothetical protein
LNLVFLINLFGDTNVTRIFYKSSQICSTHADGDKYIGTEGVLLCYIWYLFFMEGHQFNCFCTTSSFETWRVNRSIYSSKGNASVAMLGKKKKITSEFRIVVFHDTNAIAQ